nr:ribonuclease H-like domain-containing protein [Tanacetum cinerariifolium]
MFKSVSTAVRFGTSGESSVADMFKSVSTAVRFGTSRESSVADLEQIHPYDIEEMDLRWQMALLTMRARRFLKKTRRKLTVNGNECLSTNRVVNTAQAVNTANRVSTTSTQVNTVDNLSDAVICAFLASQPNMPQLAYEDLEQIQPYDIEDIDLRWQMALLTMRARRFLKKTRRKLTVNGNECLRQKKDLTMHSWVTHLQNEELLRGLKKSELMVLGYKIDNYKKELGNESYNAVPPPYTRNFMPLKPDFSYTGLDEFVVKPVVENKSSEEETKAVRKNPDASIIEEWVSDDEEETMTQPKIAKKIVRPDIVKKELVNPRQQEKTVRKTIKKVEHNKQNTHRPRGNKRN